MFHLFFSLFLATASMQIYCLMNLRFLKNVYSLKNNGIKFDDINTSISIDDFIFWSAIAFWIGQLITFFISLSITFRKKLFLLNSYIVLLIELLLLLLKIIPFSILRKVSFLPGKYFINISLEFSIIVNIIVFSFLGITFLIVSNNYVNNTIKSKK